MSDFQIGRREILVLIEHWCKVVPNCQWDEDAMHVLHRLQELREELARAKEEKRP